MGLPHGVIVAMILRGKEELVPRGNIVLKENDILILGAEALTGDFHVALKEITLHRHHPWNGQFIRDLDISRKTIIVMVKRDGKTIIPKGNIRLLENDQIILYSHTHIPDSQLISV